MIGTTKIRKINNKANLQNAGTLVGGGIKQSKLQILMIYCDIIQLLHDIHLVITHQRRNIEVRDGDFNFRLLCIIQSHHRIKAGFGYMSSGRAGMSWNSSG